ncbi:MAG TPA: hypothetical protein DSN98_04835 [Thermoplasmata archaeon]|jgi:hypothetical protein|nr:MAG TPA: hypothetical protein DSN98_04835 [Thermoplasmata archaeon]
MNNKNEMDNAIIQTNAKKIDSAQVGDLIIHGRTIKTPSFIHEIDGKEDAYSIFEHQKLITEPHIIAFPAHRWMNLLRGYTRSSPKEKTKKVFSIYRNHHVLIYEAPEMFLHTMPFLLLKHGLSATGRGTREFNKLMMIENNKQGALKLLPEFERLFLESQWDLLRYNTYKKWEKQELVSFDKVKDVPLQPKRIKNLDEVWKQTQQSAYGKHLVELIEESSKIPSSTIVTAVKPLLSTSDKLDRELVAAQNKQMLSLYEKYHPTNNAGRPWLHLFLNHTIFTEQGDTSIHNIIDEVVTPGINPDRGNGHAGICVTLTDWQKAWEIGTSRQNLEGFITDLGTIASQYKMPLYLARAKWIGEYLIDFGATLTGCMLNGHTKYTEENTGAPKIDDPKRFGRVPLYGFCNEVFINDLFNEGKKLGELKGPKKLYHFDNIPDVCNTMLQYDHERFRCDFAKPRRIVTHCSELKQMRDDLNLSKPNPGRNYIQRSLLWGGGKQD